MEILVLGCSSVFLRRVVPALNVCESISKINIASKSKSFLPVKEIIGEKFGYWFDSYSAAIDSSCSDLAYISLPNNLHYLWAKNCLQSGMHVIVEKPATLSLEDTEYLINLSRRKNLCLAESTVWPFHPNIDLLREHLKLFKDKPVLLEASFTMPDFEDNNIRNFPELGGGAFNDLSAYAVSIGRVLFNENPLSVNGKLNSYKESNGIDTGFSIDMRFNNNKRIKGIFGFGYDYKNKILINGSDFMFELNRVFSPPPDIELQLKMIIDNKNTSQSIKADAYRNFFELVIKSCNTKEYSKWSKLLHQDAKLVSKLKPLIIPNQID